MARADPIPENRQPTFMALASTPETATRAETALAVSPLLGFIHRPPLLRVSVKSPLQSSPRGGFDVGDAPARRIACSAHVVFHHLDGLLLFAAAGLLHPAPGPGVHCVSRIPSPHNPKIVWRAVLAPRSAWSLRSIPPPIAVLRHRSPCPLVVTSCLRAVLTWANPLHIALEGRLLPCLEDSCCQGTSPLSAHREARFRAFLNRRVCGVQLAMKRDLHAKSFHGFRPPPRCAPRRSLRGRSPRCRSNAPCEPPKRCTWKGVPCCCCSSRPRNPSRLDGRALAEAKTRAAAGSLSEVGGGAGVSVTSRAA